MKSWPQPQEESSPHDALIAQCWRSMFLTDKHAEGYRQKHEQEYQDFRQGEIEEIERSAKEEQKRQECFEAAYPTRAARREYLSLLEKDEVEYFRPIQERWDQAEADLQQGIRRTLADRIAEHGSVTFDDTPAQAETVRLLRQEYPHLPARIVVGDSSSARSSSCRAWGERRFVDGNELLSASDPVLLVNPILMERSLIMGYGPPASFKSLFALDLGLSLSQGVPLLGAYPIGTKLPVAFVCSEGSAGLKQRIMAWMQVQGVDHLNDIVFCTESYDFADEDDTEAAIDAIRTSDLGPKPLIIIDTLTRNHSGDENSTKDMAAVLNNLGAIITALDATVFVVHHAGKDVTRGMRGNSALLAAADTVIEFERKEGAETAIVRCKKMKDAPEFGAFVVRASPVTLPKSGTGDERSSLILTYDGSFGTRDSDSTQKIKQIFNDVLLHVPATKEAALSAEDIAKRVGSKVARTTIISRLDKLVADGLVGVRGERPKLYFSLEKNTGSGRLSNVENPIFDNSRQSTTHPLSNVELVEHTISVRHLDNSTMPTPGTNGRVMVKRRNPGSNGHPTILSQKTAGARPRGGDA